VKSIEKNECVIGKMLDFRNLLIIQAVLNRKRMNAKLVNQFHEVMLLGIIVIEPDIATLLRYVDCLIKSVYTIK
jgi:hypothetical protein